MTQPLADGRRGVCIARQAVLPDVLPFDLLSQDAPWRARPAAIPGGLSGSARSAR